MAKPAKKKKAPNLKQIEELEAASYSKLIHSAHHHKYFLNFEGVNFTVEFWPTTTRWHVKETGVLDLGTCRLWTHLKKYCRNNKPKAPIESEFKIKVSGVSDRPWSTK